MTMDKTKEADSILSTTTLATGGFAFSGSLRNKLAGGLGDKLAKIVMQTVAIIILLLLTTMVVLLFQMSGEAIKEFGFGFLTSSDWDPIMEEFGALPFLYGTIVTSVLALMIAAPVSVMVAIFVTEILPAKLGQLLGLFVEMIAAIPSIVFGLWGLFFLAPMVRETLTPLLQKTLGFLPIFDGPSFGIGILTAALILAIMIVPTITSIAREVFKTVPQHQKEAALALGATREEMIRLAVLRPSFSGITGAIVLGFGRALGETMAVAMVIGNSSKISFSLFAPGATMSSVIANEYAEASAGLHLSSLCLIGLVLFVVTLMVNSMARVIVWKFSPTARSAREEKRA